MSEDADNSPGERNSYRRKGKIARLPFGLRSDVNTMLRDGSTYPQIIRFLEKHEVHVNQQNLTNWQQGGYQDWLSDQERMDAIRLRSEASLALVRELKGSHENIEDANSLILASQINEVLQDIDVGTLKDLLRDNPEKFLGLAQSINTSAGERTRRVKVELELEKYRAEVAETKRKLEATMASARKTGGVSKETLARVAEDLKLL